VRVEQRKRAASSFGPGIKQNLALAAALLGLLNARNVAAIFDRDKTSAANAASPSQLARVDVGELSASRVRCALNARRSMTLSICTIWTRGLYQKGFGLLGPISPVTMLVASLFGRELEPWPM